MQTENPQDLLTPSARWLMGLRMEAAPGTPPATTTPPAPEPAKPAGEGEPTPPAATPPTPATPPAPTGTPAGGEDEFDKDRAMATIRRQRASEEAAKAEAKAAKDELERVKRGEMTPEERQAADLKASQEREATLTRRANEATLFATIAVRDDIADAEIARDLLIASGLTFDDDGKPVDLESHVEKLLENKPILKKSGQGPAPTTPPPAGEGSPPPPNANGAAGSGGQGPPPPLDADEVKAANEAGMTPERFSAMKGGMSLSEWEADRKKQADAGGGGG